MEKKILNIAAVSDTHGFLPEVRKNTAEIAIIAGDISPLEIQGNSEEMKKWLFGEFLNWVIELDVKQVFLIAGNHDFYFQNVKKSEIQQLKRLSGHKLVYIKNESTIYTDKTGENWSIFGTPYCNIWGGWPFMVDNNLLTEKFKSIPDKVDIIITHSPPFAFGDADLNNYEHVGNKPLAKRLENVDYKIIICGHIHGGNHEFNEHYRIQNVSYLDNSYRESNEISYITITK